MDPFVSPRSKPKIFTYAFFGCVARHSLDNKSLTVIAKRVLFYEYYQLPRFRRSIELIPTFL